MSRSIRAAVEACLLVIAFAAALLMAPAYGRTVVSIAPIAAALLIAALSLLYGRALGRLLRIPLAASHRNAFELVVGFSGVSLVHLTATAVSEPDGARCSPCRRRVWCRAVRRDGRAPTFGSDASLLREDARRSRSTCA